MRLSRKIDSSVPFISSFGSTENRGESHTDPTQSGEFRVTGIHPCASANGEGQPLRNADDMIQVGAVCGSAARTDLCGGRSVMIVATATFEKSGRNEKERWRVRSLRRREDSLAAIAALGDGVKLVGTEVARFSHGSGISTSWAKAGPLTVTMLYGSRSAWERLKDVQCGKPVSK